MPGIHLALEVVHMKVAIPLFGNRISPRFDFSPEVWIVELKDGETAAEEKLIMADLNLPQRLDRLATEGVNKVICGGIDGYSLVQFGNRGIDVIHNVAGEAEEVLGLFKKGLLRSGSYCDRKKGRGFCGWRRRAK